MDKTFAEIVRRRRAVRVYDADKPLDSAVVRECIELATLAPNSTNLQLWSFQHVTDPGTLKALAQACFDQNAAQSAQQMVVFTVRCDLWRARSQWNLSTASALLQQHPNERTPARLQVLNQYYTKLIPFVYGGGWLLGGLKKALMGVVGLFRPVFRQLGVADARIVAHKSCALAAQTFMLGMTAAGYDTCPLEGFDSRRVQKILNLPRRSEINMIITCGIRADGGVYFDRYRVPFDEVYRQV